MGGSSLPCSRFYRNYWQRWKTATNIQFNSSHSFSLLTIQCGTCKCSLFYFIVFRQIRAKRSESQSKHRVNFEKWNKLTGSRRNVLLSSSVSEMPVSTDFNWKSWNINNRRTKETMDKIGLIRHLIISTLMKKELSNRLDFRVIAISYHSYSEMVLQL